MNPTHALKINHPATGQVHIIKGYSLTEVVERYETHLGLGWVAEGDINIWFPGEQPFAAGWFR